MLPGDALPLAGGGARTGVGAGEKDIENLIWTKISFFVIFWSRKEVAIGRITGCGGCFYL